MTDDNDLYILDDKGEPIPEPDPLKWAQWFGTNKARFVKQEDVGEGVWVSTVFLGIDHNFSGGEPILWETMAFTQQDRKTLDCRRCGGSREQAEAMHRDMVKKYNTPEQ
jgi:hypothetical protein